MIFLTERRADDCDIPVIASAGSVMFSRAEEVMAGDKGPFYKGYQGYWAGPTATDAVFGDP